jgi:hypothetical protein
MVRVPGYRSRGQGSISGTTRFSEKYWVWNGVHSTLWVELRSSGLGNREYGRKNPLRWPHDTLYSQKLALTSPTSGKNRGDSLWKEAAVPNQGNSPPSACKVRVILRRMLVKQVSRSRFEAWTFQQNLERRCSTNLLEYIAFFIILFLLPSNSIPCLLFSISDFLPLSFFLSFFLSSHDFRSVSSLTFCIYLVLSLTDWFIYSLFLSTTVPALVCLHYEATNDKQNGFHTYFHPL